jgi:anhydro-N-acetylmuramic acid kinase
MAVPEVIISGGGRHHPGVFDGLSERLAGVGCTVRKFDDVFYDGDAKEAVAFALLGYLTVHGQPGNLPAATGARGPRVLGSVTPS